MKNERGYEVGPKLGWAEWAEKQARKILKPRRNATAQRLNKPNPKADTDTSSAEPTK